MPEEVKATKLGWELVVDDTGVTLATATEGIRALSWSRVLDLLIALSQTDVPQFQTLPPGPIAQKYAAPGFKVTYRSQCRALISELELRYVSGDAYAYVVGGPRKAGSDPYVRGRGDSPDEAWEDAFYTLFPCNERPVH